MFILYIAITNMRNETQYDCSEGFDMEFGISWKGTRKNSTVSQHCPNGTGINSCSQISVILTTLFITERLRQYFKSM